MNVVIATGGWAIEDKHVEMVKEALPGAQVYLSKDGGDMLEKGIDADIIVGPAVLRTPPPINVEYCLACKNLKWIHCLSAGVETIALTQIGEIPGLRVSNTRGTHGIPISEHVIGYLLSQYRRLEAIRENQKTHSWKKVGSEELYGKTIAIIGAGSIGTNIAKRCKPFGTTILGVKRTRTEVHYMDEIFTSDEVDQVLVRADVVILVVPITPETHRWIDASKFALMKPSALFINVGRGATIDDEALVEALRNGTIAGAMLDAFEPEPLPEDHPFWAMDNVWVTSKTAANSPYGLDRAFEVFQTNARYFLANQRLPEEVDLALKY